MDIDTNRVLPEEDELDIDHDSRHHQAKLEGNAASVVTSSADAILQLEQALDAETRDISSRFQGDQRPQPPGLDQALPDGRYRGNTSTGLSRDNPQQHRYASRDGGFVTGFDLFSKEEKNKRADRAARFGSAPQGESKITDQSLNAQESGMDVDDDGDYPRALPEAPPRTSTIRHDAIHLFGTDEMSTKDILKYFEVYGPSHVEWIDDSSCNVVFPDQHTAKRALYFQLVDQTSVSFGEDDDPVETGNPGGPALDHGIDSAQSTDDSTSVPPTSLNCLKKAKPFTPGERSQSTARANTNLFIRYATDYDIKQRGAASRSHYYATHGREDSKPGISSLHRRDHQYGRRSRADDQEVWSRGRGISSFSRLKRKMEGDASPSPSPPRRRSWSRNRRLAGSRSRSRSTESKGRRSRSRSPGYIGRRERGSRSPESRLGRLRSDDYENRGRRGDISLRLGERVKDLDETEEEQLAKVENRMNDLAGDFLAELESTFTRREKMIPKSKTLYSEFYEKEYLTERPAQSKYRRDRDYRGGKDSSAHGGESGRRRRDHKQDRDEALRAISARLGPLSDDVDEFGRSRR
ncbi:hypothetical protein BGW38_001285 [Lunasporangiospora selenospora]|uniref:Nuclear cap-binding protein subunit 3 n=1 Tax=Lunasporangiospora selenospora TaxID=979761 RepID=A0A9P6G439_9FUNG|nr:hypothetical protein BGW38_001285 [Lunasporangiospora selenospora]